MYSTWLSRSDKKIINNPNSLFVVMQKLYQRELRVNPKRVSYFWVLSLGKDYRLLDLVVMDQKKAESGKLTMNEVLRFARLIDASYVAVVMTDPAGDWEIETWVQKLHARIAKACEGNETPLVEWMMISEKKYYSFRMEGML